MNARAIADLNAVSGTWHGTIHVDVYGDVPFTLVITPDGAYEGLIAGVTPLDGRMAVADGERRLVGRTDAGETYQLAPDVG